MPHTFGHERPVAGLRVLRNNYLSSSLSIGEPLCDTTALRSMYTVGHKNAPLLFLR